jgi:hypothetical protein
MFIARKRLGKHVYAFMQATVKGLLGHCVFVGSALRLYDEDPRGAEND